MIRKCEDKDFEALYEIINDAAQAYKGVIPADLSATNPIWRKKSFAGKSSRASNFGGMRKREVAGESWACR